MIYDGQRRLLAAQASGELAGADRYEGLTPVQSLVVLLLDHEPGTDEIRRIQAQANRRECLSLVDQQEQLPTAGTPEPGCRRPTGSPRCAPTSASRRSARTTCAASSPSPTRFAPASPSARPASRSSHDGQPPRRHARDRTAAHQRGCEADHQPDLHDKALHDLGAFVHRPSSKTAHVRRTDRRRLDVDATEQIEHARAHLTADGHRQLAAILGCELERLDAELDTLAARAKSTALELRITGEVRDRARNGRYAFVHERGHDFAAGIWVVDPAFMLDLAHEQLRGERHSSGREDLTSPAPASTTMSSATRRQRTSSAGRRLGPGTPTRPAAISGSGTTSAPV